MNEKEMREIFQAAIDKQADPEKCAKLEVLYQYIFNVGFRNALVEYTFNLVMNSNS